MANREDFFTFVSEDGSVFPAMHIRVNPDIEEIRPDCRRYA